MKSKVDILFIIPPFHTRNGGGNFFPLGLGYIISRVEKAAYTYDVIDCTKIITSFFSHDLLKLESELHDMLIRCEPLLIGVGPCITTQIRALNIISRCCKRALPATPFFAGGPFPSIDGQEHIFYKKLNFEFIIKGDGEEAVIAAIDCVKNNGDLYKCNGISTKHKNVNNVIHDIDNLPFPHRPYDTIDNLSLRRKGTQNTASVAMITSRGCINSCNYCVSGNNKNTPYRKRSTRSIIKEIQHLVSQEKASDIVFYDDCFFCNPIKATDEVTKFCDEILAIDLHFSWQIEMRPDFFISLTNNDFSLLSRTGCRQINIGIEKLTENGLNLLGKPIILNDLYKQCMNVKRNTGIKLSATFILGGENETKADIKLIIEESKKLNIDFAHYNPLFVYPGTPLYWNMFKNEYAWVDYVLSDDLPWGEVVYETTNLNREDLLSFIDEAYDSFYKDTDYYGQMMVLDRFNVKGDSK